MSETRIDEIMARLYSLQEELEDELERILEKKRADFEYTLKRGKVRFKRHIRDIQRRHKKGIFPFLIDAEIKHIISAPLIYSVIFPLLLLDLFTTSYQQLCFRLYGIPIVKRSNYIVIDRQHLEYLNVIEKLNCMYCGYGNGLIAYVREIIARTEQYWCPIKHAQKVLDGHRLIQKYTDYGDALAYREQLQALREDIAVNKNKHA